MRRSLIGKQLPAPSRDNQWAPIAPLVVWLILQGLAISLAVFRVPLWLHSPDASESLAIYELITVQILASSLLFARLTETWRATVMTIAGVWPFAILAGFLANASVSVIVSSGAYVSGWILALALWNFPLTSTQTKLTATSFFAAWCAAGPLLLFLGYEYSAVPLSPPTPTQRIAFGPLLNAYGVVSGADMFSPGEVFHQLRVEGFRAISSAFSPWLTSFISGFVALAWILIKMAFRNARRSLAEPFHATAR